MKERRDGELRAGQRVHEVYWAPFRARVRFDDGVVRQSDGSYTVMREARR